MTIYPLRVRYSVLLALTASAATWGAAHAQESALPRVKNVMPMSSEVANDPGLSDVVSPAEPGVSGDSSTGEAGRAVDPGPAIPGSVKDFPAAPNPDLFRDAACEFDGMVGKKLDEAALQKTGRPYRIVVPGMAVTQDFSPDRINVEHDKGIVTRVWCG